MQQMHDVASAIGQSAGAAGAGGSWPQLPEELRDQPAAQAILSDALRQTLEARTGTGRLPL